jgi:hypothetical protein
VETSSSQAVSRSMARSFFPSCNWYTYTYNLLRSSLSLIISSSSAHTSACSHLFSLKVGSTSSSYRHWCSTVFITSCQKTITTSLGRRIKCRQQFNLPTVHRSPPKDGSSAILSVDRHPPPPLNRCGHPASTRCTTHA